MQGRALAGFADQLKSLFAAPTPDSSTANGEAPGIPWTFRLALVFGVLILLLFSCQTVSATSAFGVLFILSGAAFFVGSLTGFLFGIPKSSDSNADGSTPRYRDNANLNEVSDWLTKIIIGVGLVELKEISGFFGTIGDAIEPALAPTLQLDGVSLEKLGRVIGQGAIVYFGVLGFLFMYLWTRLEFYKALSSLASSQLAQINRKVDEIKEDISIKKILTDFHTAIAIAAQSPQDKRELGNMRTQLEKVHEILAKDPLNREAAILLSRYASEVQAPDLNDEQGNREAIKILDEFLAKKEAANQKDKNYADVIYTRSCHYSRIYRKLKGEADKAEAAEQARKQALADLAVDLKIDPAAAQDAIEDDDFKPLLPDPEFRRLTGLPAT